MSAPISVVSRHPSNNKAVQRLLQRAAYAKGGQTWTYHSILEAARKLAEMQTPAATAVVSGCNNGKQKLVVDSSSSSSLRRVNPFGQGMSLLLPKTIPGVGMGNCRVVNECAYSTSSSSSPPLPQHQQHTVTTTNTPTTPGARQLPYDVICGIRDAILEVMNSVFGEGKILISTTGAHRRGAPYTSAVELLIAHVGVQRSDFSVDGNAAAGERLIQFVDRAIRALCNTASAPTQGGRGIFERKITRCFQHMVPSAPENLCFSGCTTRCILTADIFREVTSNVSLHTGMNGGVLEQNAGRTVTLRWTTADRYSTQLFLLTGPSAFTNDIVQRARLQHNVVIDVQGTRLASGPPPVPCASLCPAGTKDPTTLKDDVSKRGGEEGQHVTSQHAKTKHRREEEWHYVNTPTENSLFALLKQPYVHPFNR